MKPLLKSVFFKNYFIALCASAWYLSSATILNKSFLKADDVTIASFIFFSTVLMYNLDRLFGDEWPLVKSYVAALCSPKTAFQKSHAKVTFQIVFVLPILVLLVYVPAYVVQSLIAPLIVAFLYAFPIGKNAWRLREAPFAKIFTIAFVWAWIGAFLTKESFSNAAILLFAERFLFIYALTIPFDLRDVDADKYKNILTIPQKLGSSFSIFTAFFSLVFSLVIALKFNLFFSPWLLVSYLFAAFLLYLWKPKRKWFFYLFFIDGCILLQSLAIVTKFYTY